MIPKVLICDDMPIQRSILKDFIKELNEPLEIYETGSGKDAIELCRKDRYHIIFMDIQMQPISGLDAAKQIRKIDPDVQIIFVTSFDNYVTDALREVHCYDYLVKPISKKNFQDLLQSLLPKVRTDIKKNLVYQLVEKAERQQLRLEQGKEIVSIPFEQISFVEKKGKISLIHTVEKAVYTELTLEQIQNMLDDTFFRCHKSYIVHIPSITKIEPLTMYTDTIYFKGCKCTAKSSARKRKELRELLKYDSVTIS